MNICIFKGWVQEKPEVKITTTGKQVTRFDIAVPRRFKGADGKREYDYITVEAWEGRADFCGKHLNKGSEVVVESELRIEKYDKDGQKRTRHIYLLNGIEFCSGQGQAQAQSSAPAYDQQAQPQYVPPTNQPPFAPPNAGYEVISGDEDLPF